MMDDTESVTRLDINTVPVEGTIERQAGCPERENDSM